MKLKYLCTAICLLNADVSFADTPIAQDKESKIVYITEKDFKPSELEWDLKSSLYKINIGQTVVTVKEDPTTKQEKINVLLNYDLFLKGDDKLFHNSYMHISCPVTKPTLPTLPHPDRYYYNKLDDIEAGYYAYLSNPTKKYPLIKSPPKLLTETDILALRIQIFCSDAHSIFLDARFAALHKEAHLKSKTRILNLYKSEFGITD